eukprot:752053-Hanusia_phi.AAC.2
MQAQAFTERRPQEGSIHRSASKGATASTAFQRPATLHYMAPGGRELEVRPGNGRNPPVKEAILDCSAGPGRMLLCQDREVAAEKMMFSADELTKLRNKVTDRTRILLRNSKTKR